ncbi:EF-hand calcium-binding domain-containing protein 7-like [Xenia sp. Carnegie-2017]|uniref:EF-hand calcium-binding domain-containing protein 7-like n=1 Tax=Xenia sp. Carnegie-2017 TaxID=2897299 RepID=UPI001F0454A5|nr:EF-hand calcium-binding domain-containing protein 7-like [Xenia sp. Carnegie-2017]
MSHKSSLVLQNPTKLDEECRMAYLAVVNSTTDNIKSSKELAFALQYAGRNPSQKSIERYWKDSAESISYSKFCAIMKQEKQNTKNELLSAFKKMDINGDGFISLSELKKTLSTRGEKMDPSEVEDIFKEADGNKDDRLDYEEFCDMLMSTVQQCKEISQNKIKDEFRVDKSSSSSRKFSTEIGSQKSPVSARNVVKEPKILRTVERRADFTLFILKESSGELVAFTKAIANEKSCVLTDIPPGEYDVVVFTAGCQIRTRKHELTKTVDLLKNVNGEIQLTKRCRDSLAEIFHTCDLDGNGYLNRQEFDIFQMRTSGESCDDDAWQVMIDNFHTKNDRDITLKGFLDLNLMEARDAEGDSNDLWITFKSMGYNRALEPDQVAFFVIEIYSKDSNIELEVSKIDDKIDILTKVVIQSIVKNSTTRNVKRMRDLILHRYEDEQRVSLAVENKSRQSVMVRLNCDQSENCLSHRSNLNCVIKVEAKSIEIGHHITALDPSQSWSVSCEDSVLD